MNKDPSVFLKHIIESIVDIENYTQNCTKEKFLKKKMMQDAVIKRIEVIGEACKNLPKEFIEKNPSIAWKDIIGTRDRMVHHYFGVDLPMTWDITKKDLPILKQKITKIIKELDH